MNKKKLMIFVLIACVAVLLYWWYFKPPMNPMEKAKFQSADGKTKELADFKGQAIVLSYFQSWCGDCRRELPELLALQKTVGGEDSLKLILISDENWGKINIVKNIANSSNLEFLHSLESLHSLGIKRYPTTYLLDKSGKEVKVDVEGIYWNNPEIIQLIRKINQK
jgi:thiol-disulfide isomerase/thioredoxin